MVTMTIDGMTVQVPEGTTILEAAKTAHIRIPHLCYLKGINEIAACRVCCVEVEGERAMVTACNNPVKEGMVVHTNSPRARTTRRTNVELILSQHDCKCATCVRSGNCQLQAIANDLGILSLPYESQLPRGLRGAWTTTFPLYHDYNTVSYTHLDVYKRQPRCSAASACWQSPAAAPECRSWRCKTRPPCPEPPQPPS